MSSPEFDIYNENYSVINYHNLLREKAINRLAALKKENTNIVMDMNQPPPNYEKPYISYTIN